MLYVQQINGNKKMNPIKTEKEKIADTCLGIESDSKRVVLASDGGTQQLKRELKSKEQSALDEGIERYTKHMDEVEKTYNTLKEDQLEIFPLMNNVLVKPFEKNPFQKIITAPNSGLILDMGGLAPEYKSHEDGEIHEEEAFIRLGVVVEVGAGTNWVQRDDVVMWTKPSELPIPFFKQGLLTINETRIMAVINTNLSSRLKKKQ